MIVWRVVAVGCGFKKDGVQHDCELSGLVRANNINDAFSRTCTIAMQNHPELLQSSSSFPRPTINAEEIQEVPEALLVGADRVELHWIEK